MAALTHRDDYYMALAIDEAAAAARAGEVPVGAVVVKDGLVVATGRNRTIEWNDPSAHAEVVALREAARVTGSYRLPGVELFVTLEPCAMCSGAIFHSRLKRVVYGAPDSKTGCAGSVVNLFANPQLNHHTIVSVGVLERECSALLTSFFERRRLKISAEKAPLREDTLRTPMSAFAGLSLGALPDKFFTGHDGFRMHYSDAQTTVARNVVLCLHDFPYWSFQLTPCITRLLATPSRVIAPDLLGCGLSDKPKEASWHSAQAHAELLRELFVELSVTPSHIIALGRSRAIALELIKKAEWSATRLASLPSSLEALPRPLAPKASSKVSPVWTRRVLRYIEGTSGAERRAIEAPFVDRGHAAILKGMQHPSFQPNATAESHVVEARMPPHTHPFMIHSASLDGLVAELQEG